jgi:hypothetical protein
LPITTNSPIGTETTTTSPDEPVKFKLVNYTLIGGSDHSNGTSSSNISSPSPIRPEERANVTTVSGSKSYSLRLHIKGYKWKEKFSNVSSPEAQEFLKQKILPLLYKNLNLSRDELNDIKLLRLFKEKRSN